MAQDMTDHESSRRRFIKKAAYITPAILSLAVTPSYAKAGSRKDKDDGGDRNTNREKKKKKDNRF